MREYLYECLFLTLNIPTSKKNHIPKDKNSNIVRKQRDSPKCLEKFIDKDSCI